MSHRTLFTAVATLLIAAGCAKDSSTNSTHMWNTPFSYVGKDSLGATFVTGSLTIVVNDSAAMSGTWKLDSVPGTATMKFGPQFGTGTWMGGLSGTTLTMNLNPGWADDNVVLVGKLDRSQSSAHYAGRWSHVTLLGETNHGTFEAQQ